MIIYTGYEDYFSSWESSWEEVEVDLDESSRLIVRPQGFNRATVVRIITSDPQLYLCREFQPGMEIELPLNYPKGR
ncbi:MAG: hypothetical protein GX052_10605 [Syntrophomonadaceae bacterium]|nr:hypothetical protein [Syntrophomonadaceae bacterium]